MPESTKTVPPVPSEVDLRDFAFMPLDVRRLLNSETWVLGRPDEKVAAMNLWLESWHQVPAGSLPDNDRMLAHLSQAGASWKKVKAHAMRGWVLCSDGRWYHQTIAEKALEAWKKKLQQRERSRKGNETRWSEKPPKDDSSRIPQGSLTDPSRIQEGSNEDPKGIPKGIPNESLINPKGQGQGQGEGNIYISPELSPPVRLAVEARRHGIECTGSDPRLIALADLRVTEQMLGDMCAEAKRRGKANLGYVAAALEQRLRDADTLRGAPQAQPKLRRVAL